MKSKEKLKKFSKLKVFGIIITIILISLGMAAYKYLSFSMAADEEAIAAMATTNEVLVEEKDDTIVFKPVNIVAKTALIYYPGGQVEPESFAYGAREIAKKGYLVVIQRMPFNLAMFGKDKGYEITKDYTEIENWYISGFSLGGVSAAMLLSDEAAPFKGLILYASYTTDSYNLANSNLKVLSISGSNDGLATPEKIESSKEFLPKDTEFYEIQGGNHTQFAIYGEGQIQEGDNEAGITRLKQQDIIVEKTVEFLSKQK